MAKFKLSTRIKRHLYKSIATYKLVLVWYIRSKIGLNISIKYQTSLVWPKYGTNLIPLPTSKDLRWYQSYINMYIYVHIPTIYQPKINIEYNTNIKLVLFFKKVLVGWKHTKIPQNCSHKYNIKLVMYGHPILDFF